MLVPKQAYYCKVWGSYFFFGHVPFLAKKYILHPDKEADGHGLFPYRVFIVFAYLTHNIVQFYTSLCFGHSINFRVGHRELSN